MKHETNRLNVTIAVMVATFLTAMDSTVVSTAMPTIISDLGGIKLMSWVFAVYLLTTAVTTPIWGKLSDLFGRKVIFMIGTSLFLLGSILSGTSQTMEQLIWFRAFQGIGAGAVFPITLTIIGDIYNFEERAKIQGLFSAVWGVSGILGPLIGGFFVDWLTWRWIFYINLPIGVISMLLLWIFLKEHIHSQKKHIDYWGALTFSTGMTALLYALMTGGQNYAWNSWVIISLFIVAVVFLAAFIAIERRTREPMLPLKLFVIRVIATSNIASFLTSAILIGLSAYLPMWVQGILGHSATSAGLTLAPMSIGWPIGATLGGMLLLRIGSRTTSLIGMAALIAGSLWLAVSNIYTSQWTMGLIMLIQGFGFGFSSTAFTVLVQSAVGWNLRGAATASNQFVRTLGQTVGVAAFGTWFNQSINSSLAVQSGEPAHATSATIGKLLNPQMAAKLGAGTVDDLRKVLLGGLHSVFLILAVIAVVGTIVVFWLPSIKKAPDTQDGKEALADA